MGRHGPGEYGPSVAAGRTDAGIPGRGGLAAGVPVGAAARVPVGPATAAGSAVGVPGPVAVPAVRVPGPLALPAAGVSRRVAAAAPGPGGPAAHVPGRTAA